MSLPATEGCLNRTLPNGCTVAFAVADATKMPLGDQSADLVFGSPPYLAARTYGIDAHRPLDEWVDFMLACTREALRVSRGLVLWVVAGTTIEKCYQPGPEALMHEAWRSGIDLWRPACWWKVDENEGGCGQPGSGGKQWLRSDWEYVLAFKRAGETLPWADPKFQRRLAKYGPGGAIRTRHRDGSRAPREWTNPTFVNPGNLVKARVGGGHQGDRECHQNEAPFPEKLASFFVQGWCPPGGLVYDPFAGSGTGPIVAGYHGRNAIGTDLRPCQVKLSLARLDRRIVEGRAVELPEQRTCCGCGASFRPRRRDQRACQPACRVKRFRSRRGQKRYSPARQEAISAF